MKKIIFISFLLILNNAISSQNKIEIDNNRLIYIYDFIINNYILCDGGITGYLYTDMNYIINDKHIAISTVDLTDSAIFKYSGRKFNVEKVLGQRQGLFEKLNLNDLRSQFAIKTVNFKVNEIATNIDDDNCKSLIQLSDIFKKGNEYYVIVYLVNRINDKYTKIDDYVFKFEICKQNGFIVFNWAITGFGHCPLFDMVKGLFFIELNCFCNTESTKSFNNHTCPNKAIICFPNSHLDSIKFDDIRIKTNIKPIKKIYKKLDLLKK